jgi:hypothetical protein
MTTWMRNNAATIWSWGSLVIGSIIIVAVTYGTSYRHLGIALLISSVSLLVIIAIFEALWRLAANFLDGEKASGSAPKSGPGAGRSR